MLVFVEMVCSLSYVTSGQFYITALLYAYRFVIRSINISKQNVTGNVPRVTCSIETHIYSYT